MQCQSYKPRNAKDCWKPPGAGTNEGRILSYNIQREHGPANTLISDFQLRELRENKFVLSLQVCGNLLKQPQEINTVTPLLKTMALWSTKHLRVWYPHHHLLNIYYKPNTVLSALYTLSPLIFITYEYSKFNG